MNAPIAESAVTRRHPRLDSNAFDALLVRLTKEFAASAAHYDRTAEFPHANLARLHEFDLLSLTVPASLGGAGASLPQALSVVRAPGNLGAPLASLPAFQPGQSRDNPLERHYRDVLCARIHTPQSDSVLQGRGARVSLKGQPERQPERSPPAPDGAELLIGWTTHHRRAFSRVPGRVARPPRKPGATPVPRTANHLPIWCKRALV